MGQEETHAAAMRLARGLMSMRVEVRAMAYNHDGDTKDRRWKEVYELMRAFEDADVRNMIESDDSPNPKTREKKRAMKNSIATGKRKRRGAPGIHKGNHPWRRRATPKT